MNLTLLEIAAFFVASLAIELTPGPNMAYLTLLSLQHGQRAGLAAAGGVALGLLVLGLAALFGFATLVSANPVAYQAVRWAGIVYLLWLAWDSWQESRKPVDAGVDIRDGRFRFFNRGLITNLLNPKAALFYVTVLPGFLPAADHNLADPLALTLIYVVAASIIHVTLVLGAGSLAPLLARSGLRQGLGAVFAGLLVLVAVWVFFKTLG